MIYFEDFTGYPLGPIVDNANPNWTVRIKPSTGYSFFIATEIAESPSGRGLTFQAIGGAGSRVVSYNPLNNINDLETLVLFRVLSVDSAYSGRQGGLLNRYSGTDEASTKGYAVNFTPTTSSQRGIWLVDDSNPTALGKKDYTWTENTRYWHRLRTVGDRIQSKTWEYGQTEPAAWDFDITDSGTTSGSYNGIGTYNNGNVQFLQYSANTDGTAPMVKPPIPTSTDIVGITSGIGGHVGAYAEANREYYNAKDVSISGKSNIYHHNEFSINGKSRIKKQSESQVLGKSRIISSSVKSIKGSYYIQLNSGLVIKGQSNISKGNELNVLGRANIYYHNDKQILGKSRIHILRDAETYGQSHIVLHNESVILGKSRITKGGIKEVKARSNIKDNEYVSRAIGIAYTNPDFIYGSLYNKDFGPNIDNYELVRGRAFTYESIDINNRNGNI